MDSPSTAALPQRRRSIIYVDGFNFFYGAIKGSKHYWLDLERYFVRLRQHDDVQKICYFTAIVTGSGGVDQKVYLKALSASPKVEVSLGRFKTKRALCTVQQCVFAGHRHFETWEEKRSDVGIATRMIEDAYQDACDIFVLVSGDSDLVPPLLAIKRQFPAKQIVVYVPARDSIRGAATELRACADKHKNLPLELLSHCHFPADVQCPDGSTVHKPASW